MEWIKGSITPEFGAFATQIIATLIFAVILRFFLWKPIKEFADKRRDYIKSQYDDAERLKHETEIFVLDAEAKKNDIYNQADQIIASSKKEGEEIKSKAINDAKFESNRKLQRAEQEIAEAKVKAQEELKQSSAELATLIAQKLIKQNATLEDQDKLIEEALNEL